MLTCNFSLRRIEYSENVSPWSFSPDGNMQGDERWADGLQGDRKGHSWTGVIVLTLWFTLRQGAQMDGIEGRRESLHKMHDRKRPICSKGRTDPTFSPQTKTDTPDLESTFIVIDASLSVSLTFKTMLWHLCTFLPLCVFEPLKWKSPLKVIGPFHQIGANCLL